MNILNWFKKYRVIEKNGKFFLQKSFIVSWMTLDYQDNSRWWSIDVDDGYYRSFDTVSEAEEYLNKSIRKKVIKYL